MLPIGEFLNNRYQIKEVIGLGGCGAVYRAYDTSLKQLCAVKENLNAEPAARRQFEREAHILAGLRHANLPRVLDYFFIPEQGQYLVMDFIQGQSLYGVLRDRSVPLSDEEAMAWIEQVCQALEYLHSQDPPIIHRDIKPQNIIVTPAGQIVLVDFGLSKFHDEQRKTSTGAQGGTYGYAPPEQYGHAITDTRSDVYALGATLYTMLTRQRPPDAIERLTEGVNLTPPRQLNRRVNPHVEQAILKAMDTTMSERFQTIGDFRGALTTKPARAVKTAKEAAETAAQTDRLNIPVASYWGIVALGAVILIVLLVILFGMGFFALTGLFSNGAEATVSPTPMAVVNQQQATPTPLPPTETATPPPTPTPLPPTETATPPPTPTPLPTDTPVPPTPIPTPVPPDPYIPPPSTELRGDGHWIVWSPDRQRYVFFNTDDDYGEMGLYLANADGSNTRQVPLTPEGPRTWVLSPYWSPDSQRIGIRVNHSEYDALYVADANTLQVLDIFFNRYGEIAFGAWSPDGQWIVYYASAGTYDQPGIYIVKTDRTEAPQLVFSKLIESGGRVGMAWSSDGQWIAFEVYGEGMYVAKSDGTEPAYLVVTEDYYSVNSMAWSPDGEWIAYENSDSLSVVKRDGTEPPRLVTFIASYTYGDNIYAWSPDGQYLFYRSNPDGPIQTYAINAN